MEIGIVKLEYGIFGDLRTAEFTPTMKIKVDLMQLRGVVEMIEGSEMTSQDIIQKQSDFALSSWFSKMNEIELADRDLYEVKSEIVDCEKYPNGSVKKCVLRYSFVKRE